MASSGLESDQSEVCTRELTQNCSNTHTKAYVWGGFTKNPMSLIQALAPVK
jgi:hypothetical protein